MSILSYELEITPAGYLLLSLLVFMLEPVMLIVLLINVYIHELGHLVCLRLLGVRIRKLILSGAGCCIMCSTGCLPPRGVFVCAAGGPLFGIIAAVVTSLLGNLLGSSVLCLFAGTALILSLFNLLPARPLDGWHMMTAVAPSAANGIGVLVSMSVLCIGLMLMYQGYGVGLAVMGVILLLRNGGTQEGHGSRVFG